MLCFPNRIRIIVFFLLVLHHNRGISPCAAGAKPESNANSEVKNVGIKGPQSKPLQTKSKILFIIGLASPSHRTALEPLAHTLAARGHNISFLTPIKPIKPNPKFVEISTKTLDQYYDFIRGNLANEDAKRRFGGSFENVARDPEYVKNLTEKGAELLFTSPEFKPWMDAGKYDLVIVDNWVSRFGHAIAYKFKAQVIIFSSSGFWGHDEETFGVPPQNSWIPNYFMLTNPLTNFTNGLTLYDKVVSTLYLLYDKFIWEWMFIPTLDEMSRTALELPEMPSIAKLEQETSLFFTNQHFSSDYPASLPPLIIQVGGLHCENSNKTLPSYMEEFIAGANGAGFIYISFGTVVNMSNIPASVIKIFFDVIGSTKTRFLWKWDADPPENIPSNVLVAEWFPQQDVLAHKKIKGFITHCGQMSTQEAIFHGVPVIALPIVADQPYNARTAVYHGFGIYLEVSTLTTELLGKAVSNLLYDRKYAVKAKKISVLFKDRSIPAMSTAVFWTEYVLRIKNTSHMKPLGMYQYWWQRRLFDVWLLFLACAMLIILMMYFILLLLFRFCKKRFYSLAETAGDSPSNPPDSSPTTPLTPPSTTPSPRTPPSTPLSPGTPPSSSPSPQMTTPPSHRPPTQPPHRTPTPPSPQTPTQTTPQQMPSKKSKAKLRRERKLNQRSRAN